MGETDRIWIQEVSRYLEGEFLVSATDGYRVATRYSVEVLSMDLACWPVWGREDRGNRTPLAFVLYLRRSSCQ